MSRVIHGTWSSAARFVVAVAGVIGALAAVAQPAAATNTPPPNPTPEPSAIANEAVSAIVASPAFAQTGFVAAVSAPVSKCSAQCAHLSVSFDGGNTWQRSPASGWNGGRPTIVLDGKGNEVLITAASNGGVLESRDEGDTWTAVGAGTGATGAPTARPSFAKDGAVALAGQQDHLLVNGQAKAITGSGGTYRDMSFAFMPAWPDGGGSSALLVGYDQGKNLPVIQHCTSDLTCSGSGVLPNAGTYAFPITLWPSTNFAGDGVVFAQTGNFVFKSIDGGNSFAPLHIGDPTAANTATPQMALAPGYRESGPVRTAYVALFQIFPGTAANPQPRSGGGVYQTTDGGTSWHLLSPGSSLDYGTMSVALAPGGRLFAGAVSRGEGLLCNDGSGWAMSCPVVGNNPRRFRKPLADAASGATPTACAGSACGAGAAGATPTSGVNGQSASTGDGSGVPTGDGRSVGVIRPTPASPAKTVGLVAVAIALLLGIAAISRGAIARRRRAPRSR